MLIFEIGNIRQDGKGNCHFGWLSRNQNDWDDILYMIDDCCGTWKHDEQEAVNTEA